MSKINKKWKIIIAITCVLIIGASIFVGVWFGIPNSPSMFKRTKYIAHRGLSSEYYENSYAAFFNAAKSDFFSGIETDVYRTKDGEFVTAHDINPFEDKSIRINENNFNEIVDLPLSSDIKYGEFVDKSVKTTICTLKAYLTICRVYSKTPIIELKAQFNEEEIVDLLDIIDNTFEMKDIYIISFKEDNLSIISKLDPKVPLMLLTSDAFTMGKAMKSDNYQIDSHFTSVNKFTVREAHAKKKTVGVWTVNSKKTAISYEKIGVDFITTNYDFSK